MEVRRFKIADCTPESFWKDVISTRSPALIDGHLREDEWKVSEKWNMEYLRSKAGDCEVVVEHRQSVEESFGKGNRQRMKFHQFLDHLNTGSENFYLTTQPTVIGEDGFAKLFSAPLIHLVDDFGLRPSLLGSLVPHQINLWMGCSKIGSCSGLHHDYHENLYILLDGKKHFTLFPPDTAHKMYTLGEIQHIHENGRIVYKGQGDVLADGSDKQDLISWKQKNKAQKSHKVKNDQSSEEDELEAALNGYGDDRDEYENTSESSHQSTEHQDKKRKPNQPSEEVPFSFSRVDLSASDKIIQELYPEFPDLSSALECSLSAGQMLYLPAGWFHNVTSTGSSKDTTSIHMAMNYWCYPPDNIHHSTAEQLIKAFNHPYLSNYWTDVWNERYSM